jgi:hypothetical protein
VLIERHPPFGTRAEEHTMKIKKALAAAAVAASALTGAGVGAVALAPTVASAQSTDNQQAPGGQNDNGQNENGQNENGQPEGRRHHGPKLEAAAKAIGVEVTELRDALENGQSIADVARAHNVSVDTVIDAMVADAREHITALVNGQKPERPADAPNDENGQGPSDSQPAPQGS